METRSILMNPTLNKQIEEVLVFAHCTVHFVLIMAFKVKSGSVLSRLDRLLPIRPRATPTNLHKLTPSSEAAYAVPARAHRQDLAEGGPHF